MLVIDMWIAKQIVHPTSQTKSDSTIEVSPHRSKHHVVSGVAHRLLNIMSEGNGLSS
jgi:hypothetical protein